MQLKLMLLFFFAFGLFANPVFAQGNTSVAGTAPIEAPDPVEANFLFNYYEQEGENSAVTGGTGTEELTDQAATIIVTIPLDSVSRLSVETTVNHYTSASSDNIDFNVSSASQDDYHSQIYIGYHHVLPKHQQEYGFRFGGSVETDVISTTLAIDWKLESTDQNRWLSLLTQAFWDDWLPIFPAELRSTGDQLIEDDKRRTYSLSLGFGQVINQRMQFAIFSDLIYQQGLLSTPFHRVYFADQQQAQVEKLPARRFKWPIGSRFTWSVNDYLVMRFYYRFYLDNFDIAANTFSIELPFKLPLGIRLYPFYRYHRQSAARYFREYRQHSSTDDYFTSDFDLSAFDSHKQGLGLSFNPIYGMTRFKFPNRHTTTILQSIDLRYADYRRQDGLSFYAISLGLNFLFL